MVLDGAVPFLVGIVPGSVQVLKGRIFVHGAVFKVLLVVNVVFVSAVQEVAVAHHAVFERGIVRRVVIVVVVGAVFLKFGSGFREFVVADFAFVFGNGIVQFQKRIGFQFILDSGVEFQGIFLQNGNELSKLGREGLLQTLASSKLHSKIHGEWLVISGWWLVGSWGIFILNSEF